MVEHARMRQGSIEFEEEEDKESAEETIQKSRILDDQRWPVIRPSIQGKSRILTTLDRLKTPMSTTLRKMDPVMV